jgi:hypothetical protein
MFDEDFLLTMTEDEREAWIAFRNVVTNLLGNNNCVTIVANMLENFKVLGVLNELKNSFFNSRLDFFPKNLGVVSEEQGECFHQDIKEMERRYQGWWNVNMVGDC